ncbi:MAG: hypothetical protein JWL70_2463 [Acidimicrobiia bacterium]|nr:hypothetical protein [Acidimicrobiia bacterium]
MALRMHWFSVLADEAGYLGDGRWLAHAGPVWPMGNSSLYSFGYGVVLMPVMLLTKSPRGVYLGALITNSLLMVSLFPLLATAARRFFGATDRVALISAGVASVYPAVLLQSNVAWSESLVMPLTVTLLLAVHALLDEERHRFDVAAVGAITGLLTWVHPRFIPVAALVVVLLALAAWQRWTPPLTAAINAAVLLVVAIIGVVLAGRIRDDRWSHVQGAPSSGNYFRAILHPRDLLGQASGELWYLVTGSLGLAGIGAAAFVLQALRHRGTNRVAPVFVLTVVAAIAALSILSSYATAVRSDQLVYGRYNEAMIPVLLSAGAVFLLQAKRAHRSLALLVAAGASVVLGLATLVLRGSSKFRAGWNSLNVLAIGPWVQHADQHVIVAATGFAVVALAIALVISARAQASAVVLLSACLAVGAVVTFQSRLVGGQKQYEGWRVPAQLKAFDSIPLAAYDATEADTHQVGMWGYPMFMPHTKIVPYLPKRGERIPAGSRLVIATMGATPPLGAEGAKLVLVDDRMQQKFWLLPTPAP